MKYIPKYTKESERITDIVCKHFGIKPQEIYNKKRTESVNNARFFVWYILHEKEGISTNSLANMFFRGRRAICYGLAKIRGGIKNQPLYTMMYERLIDKIDGVVM